jgi:hypothetical protein
MLLIHTVELSSFEQTLLTQATCTQHARLLPSADLANGLLTTAVETWGWSWTPRGAKRVMLPGQAACNGRAWICKAS